MARLEVDVVGSVRLEPTRHLEVVAQIEFVTRRRDDASVTGAHCLRKDGKFSRNCVTLTVVCRRTSAPSAGVSELTHSLMTRVAPDRLEGHRPNRRRESHRPSRQNR